MKDFFVRRLLFQLTNLFLVIMMSSFGRSEIRCIDLFQNETQSKKILSATISARSAKFWSKFDTQIMEVFSKNLLDEKIYDRRLRHVQTLESVFQLRAQASQQNQTVQGIVKIYNDYMDRAISRRLIQATEVLRPVFVFDLPDGKIITRSFGEEIPEGAIPHQQELSNHDHESLILKGLFPLGDFSITAGGGFMPTFEHDLSHLTSFIEHPEYMGQLRRLYQDRSKHPEFMKKYGPKNRFSTSTFEHRLYFYFESMTIVDPQNKDTLIRSLLLTDSMRSKMDQITLSEMEAHLAAIPEAELISHFTHLMIQADYYFIPWGGAARNPKDRVYSFHNRFFGLLTDGLGTRHGHGKLQIKLLAEFQLYVIKLRDVTVSDWLEQAFLERVPRNSRLFNLFTDPEFSGSISDSFAPEEP